VGRALVATSRPIPAKTDQPNEPPRKPRDRHSYTARPPRRAKPPILIALVGNELRPQRSNGSRQVTYNKHPLYTYVLDKRAGQTTGEGISAFGARWYAVSARGRALVKASATTSTPTTTTSPTPSRGLSKPKSAERRTLTRSFDRPTG
jgi:Secreted repeat of unknown function